MLSFSIASKLPRQKQVKTLAREEKRERNKFSTKQKKILGVRTYEYTKQYLVGNKGQKQTTVKGGRGG